MILGKCESVRTEIRQKEVAWAVTKTVNHQCPNATPEKVSAVHGEKPDHMRTHQRT